MKTVPQRRAPHRDELTRIEILAELGSSGPLNRSQLAERLRLGPATVTDHARRLVAGGYLRELPPEVGGIGRPRVPLQVVADSAYTLGLHVDTDGVVGVVTQLDGAVRHRRAVPFEPGRDPVGQLVAMVHDALRLPDVGARIRGVGVAVPGIVDAVTGLVRFAARLDWTDLPLGAELTAAVPVPVLVESELRSSAAAELLFGSGRDHDDMLVLGIGRGVGVGIVLNRRLHRGADGAAGEFGHTPVSADGPVCACGARGCLETYVSEPAIVRGARQRGLIGAHDGIEKVLARAAGSTELRSHLVTTGSILGRAVAGVVNLLAVRAVTVLGECDALWPRLEPGFTAALADGALPPLRDIEVTAKAWPAAARARGAAALVLGRPAILT